MVKNLKKVVKTSEGLVVYQTERGSLELRGDVRNDTIWATQAQIAELFGVDRSVITKHIRNIYKELELDQLATCAKIAQVQKEGSREVMRNIEQYNLDLILSVGYRVNSKTATKFRQWATKTLRDYITQGFVLNTKQIKKNHQEFLKAVDSIQSLLPEHVTLDPSAILDLVKEFSSTWQSLDAYDKDSLLIIGSTKKSVKLAAADLVEAIDSLRSELIKKGEASELFAQERHTGSVEGIIGNVMQSFGGKPMYESMEEKAAHLLYFMVKNHPYSDGNKRSGAFAFVWFLRKARIRGSHNINPSALTALTLLIAESKPEKKDQMVALVTNLLSVKKK